MLVLVTLHSFKVLQKDRGCLITGSRSHWEEQKLSPHPLKAQNTGPVPSDQKIKGLDGLWAFVIDGLWAISPSCCGVEQRGGSEQKNEGRLCNQGEKHKEK